jgi:hypothetical protein
MVKYEETSDKTSSRDDMVLFSLEEALMISFICLELNN